MTAPHLTKLSVVEWGTAKHRVMNLAGGVAGDVHDARDQSPISIRDHPVDGALWTPLSFDTYMPGSGTAGTAPAIDALIEACGGIGANTPNTSEIYTFDGELKTNTVAVDLDEYVGNALKIPCGSAVGDLTLTINPGQRPTCSWTWFGRYTAPTEAAGSASIETSADPLPAKALACTLATKTLQYKQITFNLNNEILGPNYDIAGTDGCAAPVLTNQAPSCEIKAMFMDYSELNLWTNLLARTEHPFSLVIGAVAGNIITITADLYMNSVPAVDRASGQLEVTMGFDVGWLSTNTKLTIAYT